MLPYRLNQQILKVNYTEHFIEASPVALAFQRALVLGVTVVLVFLLVVVSVALLMRVIVSRLLLDPGVAEGRVQVIRLVVRRVSILGNVIAEDELVAGQAQNTDGMTVTEC